MIDEYYREYIIKTDLQKIRDKTSVGSEVEFIAKQASDVDKYYLDKRPEPTKGVVVAKYPKVFVLDNGQSYSWVDYLIGIRLLLLLNDNKPCSWEKFLLSL